MKISRFLNAKELENLEGDQCLVLLRTRSMDQLQAIGIVDHIDEFKDTGNLFFAKDVDWIILESTPMEDNHLKALEWQTEEMVKDSGIWELGSRV